MKTFANLKHLVGKTLTAFSEYNNVYYLVFDDQYCRVLARDSDNIVEEPILIGSVTWDLYYSGFLLDNKLIDHVDVDQAYEDKKSSTKKFELAAREHRQKQYQELKKEFEPD